MTEVAIFLTIMAMVMTLAMAMAMAMAMMMAMMMANKSYFLLQPTTKVTGAKSFKE